MHTHTHTPSPPPLVYLEARQPGLSYTTQSSLCLSEQHNPQKILEPLITHGVHHNFSSLPPHLRKQKRKFHTLVSPAPLFLFVASLGLKSRDRQHRSPPGPDSFADFEIQSMRLKDHNLISPCPPSRPINGPLASALQHPVLCRRLPPTPPHPRLVTQTRKAGMGGGCQCRSGRAKFKFWFCH